MYLILYQALYYVLFTDMEQDLDEFSRSSACENPKLEKLQEIILSFYAQNEKAQGIVFCKTREMTYALMNWMKDSPSLAMLNPHNITGSNKTEKHGQTVNHVIVNIQSTRSSAVAERTRYAPCH